MSATLYPAVASFKSRVLAAEQVTGIFCQLGSAATVELASRSGFDFVLLDQEHGLGGEDVTLQQLTAAAGAPACVPIVRIALNEVPRFKRALDMGACGIMVPYIEDAAGAAAAVRAMRYTPNGERGLAKTTRATAYGADFDACVPWVGKRTRAPEILCAAAPLYPHTRTPSHSLTQLLYARKREARAPRTNRDACGRG